MLMRSVGTIREIWRYPVSSIGGEVLEAAEVGSAGMTGDRLYALVDVSNGIAAHPERDALAKGHLPPIAHHR
ncbi:MOSC N-terminal beta barrel domain-containing protein [Pseudorhizobium pelagicum]|uniref:MOSC N-terminal beta barrel domain-containing protein n=1 Tax=Pseudorhizobium pelagicum TaxID=1509405 RepID=UPI00068F0B60|nr:MOSC N-terminal beta barrel domain-containing protein [Pseudorhizobium pelagicum]